MPRYVTHRKQVSLLNIEDFLISPIDADRVVLLSPRDVTIIRSAIWPSFDWPTRIVRPVVGELYEVATDEEISQVREALHLLDYKLTGDEMTTIFTELSEAIRYHADRLYAKPCCNDITTVNVIQGTTPGGYPQYGTQTPGGHGDPETDPPPEGFSSWEEYETYKCQVANFIADGVISSLRNLGVISLINLAGLASLVGAALAGFIVVPPAAIAVMITAIVALGISVGVLRDVGDWLSSNHRDFVCGLYNADSATAAVDFFAGLLDEALGALAVASSLHPAIRTVALILVGTDTMNQLFDGSLTASYPDADCSDCNPEACGSFQQYTGYGVVDVVDLGGGFYQVDVQGEYRSAFNRYELGFEVVGEGCCWWLCSASVVAGGSSAYGAEYIRCDLTDNTLTLWPVSSTNDSGWYKSWRAWGGDANPFTIRFVVYSVKAVGTEPGPDCP